MENKTKSAGAFRKRGRPAGKNRVPLSIDERRARNAQYERERRSENADAMADLAAASGFDPGTSNADLLASVVTFIRQANVIDPSHDITSLKRVNEKLMMQIQTLQERLSVDELAELNESSDSDQEVPMRTHTNKGSRKKSKLETKQQTPSPTAVVNAQWPNAEYSSGESNYQWPVQGTSSGESNYQWPIQDNSSGGSSCQWPNQDTPSPTDSSPEYYASHSNYFAGPSHLGAQESGLMQTLPTWPEPEIKLEESETDGRMNCLHWSIEDLIDEYL